RLSRAPPRIVDPPRPRVQVGLRELPSAHRIADPLAEAALLLLVRDREPVLDQQDAVLDQQAFEDRALAQELLILLRRAEREHALHAGAVVPGPVEERDLAARGEVRRVPLEVPLRALALGGLRQ